MSTDWKHLLVGLRELCRLVALLSLMAKAIETASSTTVEQMVEGRLQLPLQNPLSPALCWVK